MVAAVTTIGTHEAVARLMARTRDELRRAVEAGEWLRTGDVAILLGLSRATAIRRIDSGQIRWRLQPGGKQRFCDPADLLRLVEEAEKPQRGPMTPPGE